MVSFPQFGDIKNLRFFFQKLENNNNNNNNNNNSLEKQKFKKVPILFNNQICLEK